MSQIISLERILVTRLNFIINLMKINHSSVNIVNILINGLISMALFIRRKSIKIHFKENIY